MNSYNLCYPWSPKSIESYFIISCSCFLALVLSYEPASYKRYCRCSSFMVAGTHFCRRLLHACRMFHYVGVPLLSQGGTYAGSSPACGNPSWLLVEVDYSQTPESKYLNFVCMVLSESLLCEVADKHPISILVYTVRDRLRRHHWKLSRKLYL